MVDTIAATERRPPPAVRQSAGCHCADACGDGAASTEAAEERVGGSSDLLKYISEQPRSALWFSGHSLTWIRASGGTTGGRLSLVEHIVPAGSASPWHVHLSEDESFYVASGAISVKVEDHPRVQISAGSFAFGPRGVPHGFRIESEGPARIVLITADPGLGNQQFGHGHGAGHGVIAASFPSRLKAMPPEDSGGSSRISRQPAVRPRQRAGQV
jgi:quercetin dioxygenase-like cupin family protein